MTLINIGAGLLMVGGLINAVPPISERLRDLAGGRPILQVLIGLVSTAIGVLMVTDFV